jgi:hypothetical protein
MAAKPRWLKTWVALLESRLGGLHRAARRRTLRKSAGGLPRARRAAKFSVEVGRSHQLRSGHAAHANARG